MTKISEQPQPVLDVVAAFNNDNIDVTAIIKARKNTKPQSLSLSPYKGTFGPAQKKHILNRALFGLSQRHFSDLENRSLTETVALLFTPEPADEPVNNYYYSLTPEDYKEKYGVDDVGPGDPFINNSSTRKDSNGDHENGDKTRREAINTWVLKRMYFQNTSIHWKMFFFLHNLLPTNGGSNLGNKGLYGYYKLLFDAAFGNYKDTIYNITLNPAMLKYLNLGYSRKGNPDENYARELQELFTVGKIPFSKFTESDVREIARVLVGWRIRSDSIYEEGPVDYFFNEGNHDIGDKQFSEFYGNKVIKGKSGPTGGEEELQELIEMIFETGEVAIYLSRRLYQFFVYPDVNEEIEQNIILPLSEVMKEKNFSLTETLKVLLSSEHFFDTVLYNSMIKSPLEFVFGMTKEFDLFNGIITNKNQEDSPDYLISKQFSDPLPRSFYFFRSFISNIRKQGLSIGEPPNVSGWPPYYQQPVYDLFWINSITIKDKVKLNTSFIKNGKSISNKIYIALDHIAYLLSYEKHADLNALLDEMTDRLLGSPLPEQTRERLIESVIGSLSPSYWTEAVNDFKTNPTAENRENLIRRIKTLLNQLFQLGEIHLF